MTKNCKIISILFFVFPLVGLSQEQVPAKAHLGSSTKVQAGADIPALKYTFRDCINVGENYPNDRVKELTFTKPVTKEKGGVSFGISLGKIEPHIGMQPEFDFKSESEESKGGATTWKGNATSGDHKAQAGFVEIAGTPTRQIFFLSSPFPGLGWESYGDYAGAPPRKLVSRDVYLFDNLGNFALVRISENGETPPHRFFQVRTLCRGDRQDAFGLTMLKAEIGTHAAHFPIEAPVLPNDSIVTKVKRRRVTVFSGTKDAMEIDDPLLPMDDQGVLTQLSSELLTDKDNLSPKLKKFAGEIADGSYKKNSTWLLRNTLLNQIKLK